MGYHKLRDAVVEKINGIAIIQVKDVVRALAQTSRKYHVIETDEHNSFGTRLVLDAATAREATPKILKRYGITSDRSEDLK